MKVKHSNHFPVLTYHSIDKSGSVISTDPETFRWQMEFLSEKGYKAVTLDTLLTSFKKDKTPLLKTVALTFDDGFQNFFTKAFPVLSEFGFKATVFLVSDFCGKNNDWAGNPPDFPSSKLLSWDEIKELHRHGIEFGSHTLTHPDLTKISDVQAKSEIVESKAKIEDMLGNEVATFAYPFGKFNSTIKQLVKKNHNAACSTRLGKIHPSKDYFSLERVDSYYLSNRQIFNRLSTKSFDGYIFFRQIMRDFNAFITNN